MSRLLSVRTAAEQLGLSWQTVLRYAHEGKLAYRRLGDGPKAPIRITQAEVDRFANARAHVAAPPAGARTREQECAALGIEVEHEFVS